MTQFRKISTDVLIVGAGPAGLMAACQLAIHHIPFRIIDKNSYSSQSSGALIVQARSLEIFQQMGIASEAISEGVIAGKVNILYNGKKITGTGINDLGETLSQFPFLLMLEQSITEKLLIKFINDRGYSVDREAQLKSFSQGEDGVTSIVTDSDHSEYQVISKYIIAADGANSTIRNLLDIPFEGKSYPNSIFIVDCKADTGLFPDEISFAFSDSSVAGFFPIRGSRWRIDGNLPLEYEKDQKLTFDVVEKNFQEWTKVNIQFQREDWFSVTRSHQKYAASIHIRNCFLIGDAAHIHTPVGAQGMNTGLQDAYNLAWKIAFVIKKGANPYLLETYSSERLGISKGFARYTDTIFRVLTSGNFTAGFFRKYVLRLFFMFLFPQISRVTTFRHRFFKAISQIDIHYRSSILSYQKRGLNFLSSGPVPGDRFPYLNFNRTTNSRSLYEESHPSSFSLVILSESIPDELRQIAENYELKIVLIPNRPETKLVYRQLGILKTGWYLIRPDMYIALKSVNLNKNHLNLYLNSLLTNYRVIGPDD